MNKLTKTALVLVALGLIVCCVCTVFAGFDFSKLSTSDPQTPVYYDFDPTIVEINSINISLSTDDLSIVESDDGLIHLKLFKYEYEDATAEVKNGVLSIGKKLQGYKSIMNINLDFGDYTSILSIPKGLECDISATLSTGDVTISNTESLGRVSVSQSTGDTTVTKSSMKELTVSCSTGDIKAENVSISENAAFTTSTGHCTLTNASVAGTLMRGTSTGKTSLINVTCASLTVDSTTGDIELTALDAKDISIKTSTGDVYGSVKGTISDYTITSDTSTGDNSLPDSLALGDKRLKVKTTTGDIEISFE